MNDRNQIDDSEREEAGTEALFERVRTKLTVVRGFSQLLRRRLRRQDPAADMHELERIGDAVTELDELLYHYERGAHRVPARVAALQPPCDRLRAR